MDPHRHGGEGEGVDIAQCVGCWPKPDLVSAGAQVSWSEASARAHLKAFGTPWPHCTRILAVQMGTHGARAGSPGMNLVPEEDAEPRVLRKPLKAAGGPHAAAELPLSLVGTLPSSLALAWDGRMLSKCYSRQNSKEETWRCPEKSWETRSSVPCSAPSWMAAVGRREGSAFSPLCSLKTSPGCSVSPLPMLSVVQSFLGWMLVAMALPHRLENCWVRPNFTSQNTHRHQGRDLKN